jgi:DNA-binding CsgD family transcriptional regulator
MSQESQTMVDISRGEVDAPGSGAEAPSAVAPTKPLTGRETEILQYLPTRLSTAEIGEILGISPNTVKTHLQSIYQKLGVNTRNEAILRGVRLRLVPESSERQVHP